MTDLDTSSKSSVISNKHLYSQGPGWRLVHPRYGVWFIARDAVAADWAQDYAQAYPGKPVPKPSKESIDTWFAEQIGWCEVKVYGVQLERPKMFDFEKSFQESMSRDTDYVSAVCDPMMVKQCPEKSPELEVLVNAGQLNALLASVEQSLAGVSKHASEGLSAHALEQIGQTLVAVAKFKAANPT